MIAAWLMLKSAAVAKQDKDTNEFHRAKIATSQFYFEHVLPRAQGYFTSALAKPETYMALSEEAF